ncbi:pyruvate dehydrogenase (acetyl-transferring) E1 component subunit alpha, partial [Candidatus Woesearchaeota archaeon]|nr:pyruvate dehydrogenase (acetyl-transferring) E1 component subunit alpha [Candidatus Woesearchaeota archaeon]
MPKKTLNEFKTEYLQVLDENGNIDASLMPKLSGQEIKKIYETMVLVRTFDQKAFNMQRQGRIGTYIQIKGQEASQVGCAIALNDDDWIFPTYRESGLLIARKHPISQVLQYWSGDERGLKAPDGINNFPISIPVGTQLPHAVGAGWAAKLRKTKQVAVACFGDGATSKGDFHEALNFAGVYNVPVIFLCQNNQYAISLPRSRQTKAETIAQKAAAYGISGIQVDGNDVFAVYMAAEEAAARARKGEGPTLIECFTYRLADHSTSDDAQRYRPKEEAEYWRKRDPVQRLEKFMEGKGMLDDNHKKEASEKASARIETEVKKFEKIKSSSPEDIFRYVFAE